MKTLAIQKTAAILLAIGLPVTAHADFTFRMLVAGLNSTAPVANPVAGIALGDSHVTVEGSATAPTQEYHFTGPVPPSYLFTVRNVGTASIQITSFGISPEFRVYDTAVDGVNTDFDTCTIAPLPPGASCSIFTFFAPTDMETVPGPIEYGTLTATANAQTSTLANLHGYVPW